MKKNGARDVVRKNIFIYIFFFTTPPPENPKGGKAANNEKDPDGEPNAHQKLELECTKPLNGKEVSTRSGMSNATICKLNVAT